jgi:serpin B
MNRFHCTRKQASVFGLTALVVATLAAASAVPPSLASAAKSSARKKPAKTIPPKKRTPAPTKSTVAPTSTTVALTSGLPPFKGVAHPAAPSFRTATSALGSRFLESHPGNQIVSPVSLSAAFTLLSLGAGGDTRKELENLLGIDSADQQRAAVAQALAALGSLPDGFDPKEQVVKLANALWVQTGLTLKPSFTTAMRDGFGAPVRTVDFAGHPTEALAAINTWASEQTDGHINKVFEQIDPGTIVALANALYAKLTWRFEADPNATGNRPFTRPDGSVVQAPTMRLGVPHGASEVVNGVEMTAIPYRGDYEMVVAATADPRPLAALDRPIGGEYSLTVRMPRFETRSAFDLKAELGAVLPLTLGPHPDLTGMGLQDGWVAGNHRAWTKTDESGTEGAAVTVMTIAVSAPPPKEVVLDRTFTYIVRHRPTGLVVFMGRVTDPTAPVPAE